MSLSSVFTNRVLGLFASPKPNCSDKLHSRLQLRWFIITISIFMPAEIKLHPQEDGLACTNGGFIRQPTW